MGGPRGLKKPRREGLRSRIVGVNVRACGPAVQWAGSTAVTATMAVAWTGYVPGWRGKERAPDLGGPWMESGIAG